MGYREPSADEQGTWAGGLSGAGPMDGGLGGERLEDIAQRRLAAFDDYVVNGRKGELLELEEGELPPVGSCVLLHRPTDRMSGHEEVQFHVARVMGYTEDAMGGVDIWIDAGPSGEPEKYSEGHRSIMRYATIPEQLPSNGSEQAQAGATHYAAVAGGDEDARVLEGISMSRGVLSMVADKTKQYAGIGALTAMGMGALGNNVAVTAPTTGEHFQGSGTVAAATVSYTRAVPPGSPLQGDRGAVQPGPQYKDATITAQSPTYWATETRLGLPHYDSTGGDYLADQPPNQGRPATDLHIGDKIAVPVLGPPTSPAVSRAPAGFHEVSIVDGDTISKYAAVVASQTGQPLASVIAQMVRENAPLLLRDGGGDVQQGILDLQPGQLLLVPDSIPAASAPVPGNEPPHQPAPQSGDQQPTSPAVSIGESKLAAMVAEEVTQEFITQMSAAHREIHPGGASDAEVNLRDIVLYINPDTHVIQYGRVTSISTGEQSRQVEVNGVMIPVEDLRLISGPAQASAAPTTSPTTSPPGHAASTAPASPSVPNIPGVVSPSPWALSPTAEPPSGHAAASATPSVPPTAKTHPAPSPAPGASSHDGVNGLAAIPGLPSGALPGFDLAPPGHSVAAPTPGAGAPSHTHEAASHPNVGQIRQQIVHGALRFAASPGAYQDAIHRLEQQIPGDSEATYYYGEDCAYFVGTVMLAEGIDQTFPYGGTVNQYNHMTQQGSGWERVDNLGNISNLQPGDVFSVGRSTGYGANGHTFIYIGNGNVIAASMGGHGPLEEPVYFHDGRNDQFTSDYNNVDIFRWVGTGQSAPQAPSQGRAGSPGTHGEQAPPTVENFSTGFLKKLAQQLGVPESDVVTDEHRLGVEAWFDLEKGNLASDNFGWYNLANTGINAPSLLDGSSNSSGLEAFKDEPSGEEALVLSVMGSYQNRIANILKDPNSKAEDVLHAIAYYDETPGDKAWAWGDYPNDPAAVLEFNHTKYINGMLGKLGDLRQPGAAARFGSIIIGPGQHGNNYAPTQSVTVPSTPGGTDGSQSHQPAPANGGAPSFGAPSNLIPLIPGLNPGGDGSHGGSGQRGDHAHPKAAQADVPGTSQQAPSPTPSSTQGDSGTPGNGRGVAGTADIPGF